MEDDRTWWYSYIIVFLKTVGMHPLDFAFLPEKYGFLYYVLNFLYYLFWHFVVLHLGVFQSWTVILNSDKTIDEMSPYALIGSIYLFGYVILCYWQFNYKKLMRLFDYMKKNFRPRSAKGLTYVTIDEGISAARKIIKIWVYLCFGGTLSWLVFPLQCPSCMDLPLKSWYPFDVKPFPIYEIVYILQGFGQTFVGIGYGICGGIHIFCSFMLCGQYDMLYASLKNLNRAVASNDAKLVKLFRERQRNLNPDDEELNQYFVSTDPDDENKIKSIHEALQDCVDHHEMILEFYHLIDDFFCWYMLPKIGYSVCIIAYCLSALEEFSLIKVSNLLMYLYLASSEQLLFTYNTELLQRHSLRAGEALMRSDWQNFDESAKKKMVMIMTKATRPIEMTAGKMYILNIDMFRTVMGSAFSYYTLLNKLKEKQTGV